METKPLTPALSDRLPPELYDRFIDHLHSHKHSLAACSIVCKSWLPTSRYHLFLSVSLTPNLANFLLPSPHAMETITPYIRDVTLGGAWMSEQQSEFDAVIAILLLKLESCRALYLETWSWGFLSDASRTLLLKSEGMFFHNITEINLKYMRFPSLSILLQFISKFPALEALSFDNVTWTLNEDRNSHHSGEIEAWSLRPLRLTKLRIRSCHVEPILSWLFGNDLAHGGVTSRVPSKLSVRVLALPDLLPGDLDIVGRVFRVLGSALQHVELGFLLPSLDDQGFSGLVDLSHNTNLCQIHVHQLTLYHFPTSIPVSHSPAHRQLPYYWLVPMLSGIRSCLEELVFIMWFSAESQLEMIDWGTLSGLLLCHPFSGLHRIRFEVMGMGKDREKVRTWLATRLGQGIVPQTTLHVKFIDGY